MSEFEPPLYISDVFNSSLFDYNQSTPITIYDGDRRYLRITGGTVSGYTTFTNGIAVNGSMVLNGSALDLSLITGITPGTISASKAVVVDANKDISAFRNLTATNLTGTLQTASQPNITSIGTLTTLSLNGSFNFGSNTQTTMNNNLIITGSASNPTTTNGLGFGFSPMTSTGRIRCYNYALNQPNHIDINSGSLYIKASGEVGVGTTTPAYTLDVAGTSRCSSLLVGTSTNAGHMISCLDSAMAAGSTRFISLGYANSDSNQLELGFTRNTTNSWSIGFHSHAMIYGTSASLNYYVGINRSSPSYQLDVNGTVNGSSYRVGGSEVINSSGVFVGSGGVDITNRIYLKNNGYGLSIRGNTVNNDTEIVSLVDGGGGHLGTYTSHALSLMTGNTDRVRVFPSGTVSIGTNSSSNARLYLTSGIGNSTIPGSDTIQKIERTGFSQPLEPIIVSNPSLVCADNIITYGALFVASDRRLKQDIHSFAEDDALRFVRDVEPIRYRLKSGDNRVHYGYIAQQLMAHKFGELIDIQADQNMEDEGDEYDLVGYRLSVDYSRSCVLLHRAMQHMLAKLEEQQATIDALAKKSPSHI